MIYLDHAATTKVCDAAVQEMIKRMTVQYGNPSSRHPMGREAARLLEEDRAAVAAALGCRPEEVYFTSGGTESDNWAIAGALHLNRRVGKHIVATALEHAAVLEPLKALEQQGYEVTYLLPDETGNIPADAISAALRADTALVTMMLVNNETGARFPVEAAARAIRAAGSKALLHTDAVQGFLKLPFTPRSLGADLLTVSAHKIGGPRGSGALYVKQGLRIPPLLRGGGQEGGLRPGTEPTALTAGFAAACREGQVNLSKNAETMETLRRYFSAQLSERLPQAVEVGKGNAPHILSLSLPGYRSEVLVRVLGDLGICVSAGSACHRGKASHVLAQMKLTPAVRAGAIRVSLSPATTKAELDALCKALETAAQTVCAEAPVRK